MKIQKCFKYFKYVRDLAQWYNETNNERSSSIGLMVFLLEPIYRLKIEYFGQPVLFLAYNASSKRTVIPIELNFSPLVLKLNWQISF